MVNFKVNSTVYTPGDFCLDPATSLEEIMEYWAFMEFDGTMDSPGDAKELVSLITAFARNPYATELTVKAVVEGERVSYRIAKHG